MREFYEYLPQSADTISLKNVDRYCLLGFFQSEMAWDYVRLINNMATLGLYPHIPVAFIIVPKLFDMPWQRGKFFFDILDVGRSRHEKSFNSPPLLICEASKFVAEWYDNALF